MTAYSWIFQEVPRRLFDGDAKMKVKRWQIHVTRSLGMISSCSPEKHIPYMKIGQCCNIQFAGRISEMAANKVSHFTTKEHDTMNGPQRYANQT